MWSVWVGGSEVNTYLLTKGQAISIANDWFNRGYDDVKIDNYEA